MEDIDVSNIDVIYAEDEETFRTISEPCFEIVGFSAEQIHMADNGEQAIAHLEKLQDDKSRPLLLLLDMRMPVMNGQVCAEKTKEMADQGKISRVPYVTICTAGADKAEAGGDDSAVHLSLPKPLNVQQLEAALKSAKPWWAARGYAGNKKVPAFDVTQLNIIVASSEPVCAMAHTANLAALQVDDDKVVEVCTEEETVNAIRSSDGERPTCVLLNDVYWKGAIDSAAAEARSKPYIVCTAVDADRANVTFDAKLPATYAKDDLEKILKACHKRWASGKK